MQKVYFFLAVMLCTAKPALALHITSGNNVRITSALYEDIYVFGSTLFIDAPIYGDVWCAGGDVTINNTVRGDLVVAGGNVYLRGAIFDDVRAAGGMLIISGQIGGDLLVAGGTVSVESDAEVGGDAAVSGGSLTIGSRVQGNIKASGGSVILNGSVGKGMEFNGGELTINSSVSGPATLIATRLHLGKDAAFHSNVRYWTDSGEINFGNAMLNGATAVFDSSLREHYQRPRSEYLGFATFFAVLAYIIASFILIALGQWLFSKTLRLAADTAQADPIRSVGMGFLYFAAVPVGIVILLATVVGIPVGLIALFFYLMFFVLAGIITALVGAHWLEINNHFNWRPIQLIFVALGLFLLIQMLGFVPFLGWVVQWLLVLIAFGAIVENTNIFSRKRSYYANNGLK